MPLLHAQFGPFAEKDKPCFKTPQSECVHMFCTPIDDPLFQACLDLELAVEATATVLHHRMEDFGWNFILTSDI